MHVGVFLAISVISLEISGLPHARGGVSFASFSLSAKILSSPCTWGCFRGSLGCYLHD